MGQGRACLGQQWRQVGLISLLLPPSLDCEVTLTQVNSKVLRSSQLVSVGAWAPGEEAGAAAGALGGTAPLLPSLPSAAEAVAPGDLEPAPEHVGSSSGRCQLDTKPAAEDGAGLGPREGRQDAAVACAGR